MRYWVSADFDLEFGVLKHLFVVGKAVGAFVGMAEDGSAKLQPRKTNRSSDLNFFRA